MAINDKENPDEGTSRSRKDIRKERRQMRAVNRDRKSMGAEPLYSKEEIKGVKKPFEAKPSTVVAGTPVVVDDTPDVEYIKAGYGSGKNEVKEVSQEFKAGTTEAEEIRKDSEIGRKVAETIKSNSLNDNTQTFDDKKNAFTVANETKEEIDNTNTQINNQVKEETENKNKVSLGGDGSTVAKITESVEPDKIDWTLSQPAIEFSPTSRDDIYAQAKLAKTKVPQLAIEKLGVQDYYPEIGRDIAVGTFTGSRIGSQTIYSGAGGVLPLGLYDARKRAIAAEIKKKEAIMDQIKDIPDIAKQFKTEYSQEYMNFLSPWLDAYKDKPEALLSNTNFLKDMNHYKSVAENFIKVDSDLRKFEELVQPKDGKPAAYATNGMLEILHKFKAGFLPGKTTDWLTGKKNISKLTETVQAIPNGYNWADDKVKTLLEKGQAEIPIYPKDGVEWNSMTEEDKSKIRNDVNGLVVSLQDGSPDYETYLTSLKKYFHFDFETMADEWVKGTSLNALSPKEKEEYRKSLAVYMLKNMPPDSIVNKIDTVANDEAERQNAQLDYQASMARINADKEMFYADFNRHTSITRALYEGMERLGSNDESVEIYDAGVNGKNGLEMEWQVYDSKDKAYKWVKGKDINSNTGRYYKSDKISPNNVYTAKSIVHVQPTKNNMQKNGSNYNVSTYGVAYESFIDMGDGSKVGATQINVPVRTPYATAVQGGKLNDGVIGSSDNAVGAKFQRTAGNIYAGGGKGRTGGSSSQYSRE